MTRKLRIFPRSARRALRPKQDGFSLVELLVALLVFSIVLAAIYGLWFGLQRTYAYTEDDIRAQDQARAAMGEMVELIRTARQPSNPPSDYYRPTIVEATATSLEFWSDSDRDDNHDLELVRYEVLYEGGERVLYRYVWQTVGTSPTGTRLVSRWVSNTDALPLFTYEDAKGQTCAATDGTLDYPMDIRTITITLQVDIYTEKAPITHVLTSVVQPRNMR